MKRYECHGWRHSLKQLSLRHTQPQHLERERERRWDEENFSTNNPIEDMECYKRCVYYLFLDVVFLGWYLRSSCEMSGVAVSLFYFFLSPSLYFFILGLWSLEFLEFSFNWMETSKDFNKKKYFFYFPSRRFLCFNSCSAIA